MNKDELYNYISKVPSIKISSFKNPEIKKNLLSNNVPNFWLDNKVKSIDLFENLIAFIKNKKELNYKIIIACKSYGSRKIFSEQLQKYGFII